MAVVIRLARRGKVKAPHYYVVVQDKEKHPKGGFIEKLGYYRPQDNPATLVLDLDRTAYWVSVGALPSDRVAKLVDIAKSGGPKPKAKKQKKFAGKFVEAAPAEVPAEPAPEAEAAPAEEVPAEESASA
jgi:small subunit ribosomal protein S16